jgi:hypothetical protein
MSHAIHQAMQAASRRSGRAAASHSGEDTTIRRGPQSEAKSGPHKSGRGITPAPRSGHAKTASHSGSGGGGKGHGGGHKGWGDLARINAAKARAARRGADPQRLPYGGVPRDDPSSSADMATKDPQ